MRPLVRLSLRRYIHSLPPVAPPRRLHDRTKVAIGASLAVAGYISWRIAGNDQRIALDAPPQRISPRTADTPQTDNPVPSAPTVKVEHERVDPPAKSEGNDVQEGAEKTDGAAKTAGEGAEATGEGSETAEEGEGAFNPVTGEINWDCPCLGGMAHGPCGQQFRDAFSCFVFSEQEPKGIDCVEKFKNMQDCFREHPDIYGEEIADDENDPPESSPAVEGDETSQPQSSPAKLETVDNTTPSEGVSTSNSKAGP